MNKVTEKLPSTVHVRDIARALGCHAQTVRRMVRNGDLPKPMRIGRGRPFWPAFEIEAALKRAVPADQNKAA